MTITARKVLEDCKSAHALLEDETDGIRFRLFWVAGIALLRAVGHVLKKVDAANDQELSAIINCIYHEWKQEKDKNAIFWEFIDNERNNLLKEYEVGFLAGPVDLCVIPEGAIFTLDENLFCQIAVGRYAGEDCRDILSEGIDWWERQLSAIENAESL